MAIGRVGRGLVSPLLAVNFVVYLIILGLASWSLDKYINGEQNHPHLGGNTSTSFLLMFALISGVIGVCSVMAGFMHLRAWRSDSLAAASSLAIICYSSCYSACVQGDHIRRAQRKTVGKNLLICILYLMFMPLPVYWFQKAWKALPETNLTLSLLNY